MSKTEENLKAAFAGESQARNKYTYFANVARKEGYHYIAKIFEETADNERRHAKDEFALLGGIGDTSANLREAVDGEHYETTEMYPTFAKEAEEEGNAKAATPLKTRNKFFLIQAILQFERRCEFYGHTEGEGRLIRHAPDVSRELGFLRVEHLAGLKLLLQGVSQVVVRRSVVAHQVDRSKRHVDPRDFVRGSLGRIRRSRGGASGCGGTRREQPVTFHHQLVHLFGCGVGARPVSLEFFAFVGKANRRLHLDLGRHARSR